MVRIDLKTPRIIVIEDRDKTYKLVVNRIPKKTWLVYFENIVNTSENKDGKKIDTFDWSGARVELVESALTDAQGYPLPEGVLNITSIPNWTSQLPVSHRLGVGAVLASAGPSSHISDAPIRLGVESVLIDAVWGANAEGKTFQQVGLRHDFKSPTGDQQRRFSRDSSRSVVVGGSRSGKTLWLGAQSTLVDLYDELITGVDGYGVDGDPFKDGDKDSIVEYMDAYHKVAAANQLFAPMIPKIEGGND
jgi:hypothetical protein